MGTTTTQTTATDNTGKFRRVARSKRWQPLFVFILVSITVVLAGRQAFHRYKEEIKLETDQELSGIAKLETAQVSNWIAERRSDAQTLRDDPLFLSEVERWLEQGAPSGSARTKLLERLSALQQADASYGFDAIALFDGESKLRLSTSAKALPEHESGLLTQSMRTGQILVSDIHAESRARSDRLEINIVAALFSGTSEKRRAIGTVVFHINPHRFLFPLLQNWPTSSPSAESLLVRREGNDVIFLNDLRHREHTALALRMPLDRNEVPAVNAVLGREGMVEGQDYRGVPVIAVISRIPGTTWKMVTKIDQAEIYAPVDSLSKWIEMLMVAFILAGAAVAMFWRRKELQLIDALHKHREQSLRHQALVRRLDYLTRYANDIIMLADDSGKIIDFNDRALEAYGYSAEEFSQMNIFELRKVEFTSQMFEDFRKVNQTGALRLDAMHVRKNGEEFPVEVSVRLVNFDGIQCQQAIVRDITERKKAEAELTRQKEFFRQVIDSDPNLIFVRNAEGKFLHANKAMAESFGLTTESIVGKFNWELAKNPEQVAKYDHETQETMKSGALQVMLNTATLSDGTRHVYQTFRKPLIQDDGTVNTLTIAMDISELKAAEEGLRRLNRSLQLLSESNAAIVHIEEEGQLLTEICRLAVETGGYRMAWVGLAEHDEDKTVRTAARYGHDEGYLDSIAISGADTEGGRGPTGTAIRSGETQINANTQTNSLMAPWRDAALARGYLSSIALPLKGNGKTLGALTIYAAEAEAFNSEEVKLLEELADNLAFGIGALRAIAWRNHAVEKLRQSEELFRYLTENTTDVVFLMSMPNGRFDYISPASTRLLGFTPQEFYHSPALMRTLVHPDCKADAEQQWEKFLAGEVPPYVEYCISDKSGTKKWVGQRNTPIWNMEKNGTLIAIQGVITDITERKQAEMQYESEHRRLRTLIQTMPELVWLKDPMGVYLSCNPQFERYFGAKEADIAGKTDYEFLSAELANDARQKDRDAMSLDQPIVYEEWIIYPDNGQHALLETVKVPMRDDAGKLIGVMGISRDITRRKKVEEELKFKNTLLVTEHESSIDGILVVDGNASTVLSFNRRFVEMWGLPEEIVESRSDLRLIDAVIGQLVEPERFLDKVQYLYDHPQLTSQDEITLHDGRVIDRYSAPMNGPDGKYYGRIWFFRDITERKLGEKRESSLRHVLDNTLDMIFIFQPDSLQFVYMNKGALDSTGYGIEELLLMTPADINPQMSEPEFREFIAPLIKDEQKVLRFESVHRCKSGADLPVEVLLQLVQENGGDKMFVAIVRDITERKRAERALRRQQAFMLQVIDTDPNRIVVKDAHGNVLLANRSMATAHGMTPDELVGRNLHEINLSPDALAVYLEGDRKVIEEGCEISQLDSVALPDGEQGWLLTEKKRLWMPDGKLCVLSISADITQQKLSEIQLAESYKELQRLSLYMENARADERARIALNLHDEMGATLAALKMRIAWLASKLPAELPQLAEEAGHITELVSGGIHTMHRIVTQLRPNLLGDVGLTAAIADYVKKFRQHTNIECLLDLPKNEIVLNANQSHTVFRILQESLNNVAKHAQASRVNITLAERDDALMMVVRDNGIGFEPSAHKEHAFGLLGIKERALMVGGKARITSKPGKGTRVAVSIPPA